VCVESSIHNIEATLVHGFNGKNSNYMSQYQSIKRQLMRKSAATRHDEVHQRIKLQEVKKRGIGVLKGVLFNRYYMTSS
jgi:hypothetical protein